eukprot:6213164-Pleurochrysis_carterae.AAC.2
MHAQALSNWFPCTVMHNGRIFRSAEHAFQAAKANDDKDAIEAISKAPTPKDAHALGNKLPLPNGWERRRLDVMQATRNPAYGREKQLRVEEELRSELAEPVVQRIQLQITRRVLPTL